MDDSVEAWGQDVFDVVAVRAMGARMVEAEKRVEAGYALMIRESFETNDEIRKLFNQTHSPLEAKADLELALSSLVRPGTEDLFSTALSAALRELNEMRAHPSSLYVIDQSTGKAVAPFRTDTVFRTPDYVDEGGTTRPGRLVVHPAVTSEIAARRVLEDRDTKIATRAAEAPATYEHESDPQSILRYASIALVAHDVEVCPVPEKTQGAPTVTCAVVIGKEYYDGVAQSANIQFHRAQMFGKALARKISEHLDSMGTKPRKCELLRIVPKEGSKLRWYEVTVRAPA